MNQHTNHSEVVREESADPLNLFVAFANRSLAIKTIECELPGNMYYTPRGFLSGGVPYKASFQPGSFYIQPLSIVSEGKLTPTTNGPVFGVSNGRAWRYESVLCYSADAMEYPRANDAVTAEVSGWESQLKMVLTLGLGLLLEAGTIECAGHSLTGRTADGARRVGKTSFDENKRIKQVVFTIPKKGVVTVDYEYTQGNLPWWLPARILVTDESRSGRAALLFTIKSCELGLVDNPAAACSPERFVPPSAFERIGFHSNSIAWIVDGNITNPIIRQVNRGDTKGSQSHRLVRPLTLAWLALSALGCGLILRRIHQTRAAATANKTQKHNYNIHN